MMYNKNGIRILDPKNTNQIKRNFCPPDQHKWVEEPEGAQKFDHAHKYFVCLKCDDKMVEAEDFGDGNP